MKNRLGQSGRKFPHKFFNGEFASFLSMLLPLDETEQVEKQRPIKGEVEGSLQELASDDQLLILHSIDLGDILKLLEEKAFVKVNKKENYIQYHTQDIKRLIDDINTRIK